MVLMVLQLNPPRLQQNITIFNHQITRKWWKAGLQLRSWSLKISFSERKSGTISHCTCNATVHLGSTKQLSTSLTLSTCLIPMALKPVGVNCLLLNLCRKNMLVKTWGKKKIVLCPLNFLQSGLINFMVLETHLCYIQNQTGAQMRDDISAALSHNASDIMWSQQSIQNSELHWSRLIWWLLGKQEKKI